jgi:excisionase family DNA binding protein
MERKIIIEMEPYHFKELIKEALADFGLIKSPVQVQTFTVNQVAKRLGMSHHYVKKLIASGVLKSTKSGRITEAAVEEYLGK